jgi:putative salt-induced outer membrane protein YdiY
MTLRALAARLAGPLVLVALTAAPAVAQDGDDERELGWIFKAELGGLWTAGNQSTSTFLADAQVDYVWPRSKFHFRVGGFSTESSLTTTTAVGTGQEDFQLNESTVTEKTAETFYSRARYDYDISERFYVFGGTDWLRNTFAGIDSRFLIAGGAGNVWVDNDRVRLSTDYAVTYTFEEEVVENPFTKANFPGLRLAYDLDWQLTTSTKFESELTGDFNLDNTDDIRMDWYNGLPIDISSVLAFVPSLRLLWRNDPALQEVPLFDGGGNEIGNVFTPLKELDTYLSLSLLFKF